MRYCIILRQKSGQTFSRSWPIRCWSIPVPSNSELFEPFPLERAQTANSVAVGLSGPSGVSHRERGRGEPAVRGDDSRVRPKRRRPLQQPPADVERHHRPGGDRNVAHGVASARRTTGDALQKSHEGVEFEIDVGNVTVVAACSKRSSATGRKTPSNTAMTDMTISQAPSARGPRTVGHGFASPTPALESPEISETTYSTAARPRRAVASVCSSSRR